MTAVAASRAPQRLADAMISAGLVAWGLVEALLLAAPSDPALRVAFVLAATLPLAWRNAHPIAVVAWAAAVMVAQEAWDVMPGTAVTPYQCLALATYALGASAVPIALTRAIGWPLAFAYPALLLAMDTDDSYGPDHGAGLVVAQLLLLAVGVMVRRRREAAAAADARLQAAAAAEPQRIAAALAHERTRLLRDIGGVIAGDLRRIERLLGDAADAIGRGGHAAVRVACDEVQATVAETVRELRRLLGVLRAATPPADPAGDAALLAHEQDRRRRDRVADATVAGIFAALLAADIAKLDGGPRPLAVAVALASVALVAALRRRRPVLLAALLTVTLVVKQLVGLAPELPLTMMPTMLIAAYAVAAFAGDRRTARRAAVAVAAGGCAVASVIVLAGDGSWTDVPVVLFLVGCAFAAGEAVRQNDGRLVTLHADAREQAATHAARRAAALARQRSAIARELHDVLAHGLSVAGVQAGAATASCGRDDAAAARSIAAAREALGQTHDELTQLAALLGGDAVDPPGVAELPALVDAAVRSGQRVRLAIEPGDGRPLPGGVGVSLYRIVQEALTNARKHAPGAETSVTLRLGAVVEVDVLTRGGAVAAAPGTGRGIAGMRERARLLGGHLEAAGVAGGFRVHAELPADAPAAADAAVPA